MEKYQDSSSELIYVKNKFTVSATLDMVFTLGCFGSLKFSFTSSIKAFALYFMKRLVWKKSFTRYISETFKARVMADKLKKV